MDFGWSVRTRGLAGLPSWVRTKFFAAAIFVYYFVCWIQACAAQQVSDFGTVHQPIATVPEIEQVEHLFYICKRQDNTNDHLREHKACLGPGGDLQLHGRWKAAPVEGVLWKKKSYLGEGEARMVT